MSINNLLYLLKRDYYLYRKPMLYILISLFLLTGFILFITTEEYCNGEFNIDITGIIREFIIVAAWLLMAAGAFYEFRQDGTRKAYLLLPATIGEKWLVRWFEVTILFLMLILPTIIIAYITFSHLINLKWEECDFVQWQLMFSYIVSEDIAPRLFLQSLLFMFGILFNRYGTIKAIFSTIAIWAVIYFSISAVFLLINEGSRVINIYELGMWAYLPYPFSIAILVISFFKLKQKQG